MKLTEENITNITWATFWLGVVLPVALIIQSLIQTHESITKEAFKHGYERGTLKGSEDTSWVKVKRQ